MGQLNNSKIKVLSMTCMLGFLIGSFANAQTGIEITDDEPSPMVVWDTAEGQPGSTERPAMDKMQKNPDDVSVETKAIMDDMARPSKDKAMMPSDKTNQKESLEKYLEPTSPPAKTSKIVDIFLENKSKAQGFLSGFTTKRADIDLKLQQHQPSDIPLTSKFQIANFGNYIRLGHEETGRLIGYSTNYFGFTSVYLEKEYYEPRDFWTRFIIAPSGQENWYLIRSYTDPKKCLTIGWSDKLRLKRCNINDKWQQWRFLREKADAYWVPNTELIDLDII